MFLRGGHSRALRKANIFTRLSLFFAMLALLVTTSKNPLIPTVYQRSIKGLFSPLRRPDIRKRSIGSNKAAFAYSVSEKASSWALSGPMAFHTPYAKTVKKHTLLA